jgi:hypothetical protein
MSATPTNNGIDKAKMAGVLDKMRDVQTEGDRWELAEALAAAIPKGAGGFQVIIDEATQEGVLGNLRVNTLRLYRDTAQRWPASKRVPNVSFSAHREAMVLIASDGNTSAAEKMLKDISKTLGPNKVTVAQVRKNIAISQGKVPKSKASATQPSQKQVDLLLDLRANGGKELIAAIGNTTDTDLLDKLNASLTKVIAHVEKLRAKAARSKVAAKAKAPSTPAPTKSTAANGSKRPVAKRADMRGL